MTHSMLPNNTSDFPNHFLQAPFLQSTSRDNITSFSFPTFAFIEILYNHFGFYLTHIPNAFQFDLLTKDPYLSLTRPHFCLHSQILRHPTAFLASMMENLDVESLVELLVGLTSSEASALVDLVNSNIIRLLELHDEAGIAIVKPTKLQEYVHCRSPFYFICGFGPGRGMRSSLGYESSSSSRVETDVVIK